MTKRDSRAEVDQEWAKLEEIKGTPMEDKVDLGQNHLSQIKKIKAHLSKVLVCWINLFLIQTHCTFRKIWISIINWIRTTSIIQIPNTKIWIRDPLLAAIGSKWLKSIMCKSTKCISQHLIIPNKILHLLDHRHLTGRLIKPWSSKESRWLKTKPKLCRLNSN